MGGGISLAPITEEILELDAARAYDPEGLSRTQLSLSKDVLQSIRRRSYTDPSFRRRRSSTSSLKNRLTLLPKYEVPAHVNAFLEKIGIDDPARTGLNASSTHGGAAAAAPPSTSSILPASLTSSRRSGSVSGVGASGGVAAAAATGRRISTHFAPAYAAVPTPAAGASTSGKDGAAPAENDRTTKLVRHIFECLGALQVSPCPHRDSSK
jgi:hypothetical protein